MCAAKAQLVGQTFGLLTVFAEALSYKGRSYWRCRCTCGNECIKEAHELMRTRQLISVLSCGCHKALAVHIGLAVGNPGRIVGTPARRKHRRLQSST